MILRWINVNRRNPNRNVQLSVAYLGPLLDTRYFFTCEEENVTMYLQIRW